MMTKRITKPWAWAIGLLLLVSLTCASCAYKAIKRGTEITQSQVDSIIDGKTTREDILVEFGDPSKILEDGKVYFYTWTRGGKGSVLGLGSGSAYTHSLVIIFDENGIVKRHKITRGSTPEASNIMD